MTNRVFPPLLAWWEHPRWYGRADPSHMDFPTLPMTVPWSLWHGDEEEEPEEEADEGARE